MKNLKRERVTAVILVLILSIVLLTSYVPITPWIDLRDYERLLGAYFHAYEQQNAVDSQSFWLQPEDGGFMTLEKMEEILWINHRTVLSYSIQEVRVLPLSLGRKLKLRVNIRYSHSSDSDWIISLVRNHEQLYITEEVPILELPSP